MDGERLICFDALLLEKTKTCINGCRSGEPACALYSLIRVVRR